MTQGMPQDAEHPLVGQTVGKYKIVKLLGEGGMGCVYMAEQQLGTTARKVALKTLHKHLSHDPSIKARFDREAGTVAALEHPNTIQVYDFGAMEDGTLYLVMEFVSGKSVADTLIHEGPMDPVRVENIMKQVCGSLEEAHGHGIVHRDLKPDNVVLCERAGQKDWVEVLDFGIAKRSSEHDPNEAKLTQQGMVLGTPPYMSPEQFTGQPVDVRSDIYALGVMAYEMLSGKLPWEANTAWEWASKHMTEVPTPLERNLDPAKIANVPQHMRDAISRALAKNKDERFASVKDFFSAFSGGHVVPSLAAAQAQAPVPSGGQPARPKTEMAQPMMGGGPPPGAMTPPGAFNAGPPPGPMPGPMHGMGGPVGVPPGPQHSRPQKSGPPLVPILGGVAALLILGSVGAYFATKKKPVDPTSFDPSTLTSASASAATTDPSAHPDDSAHAAVTAAPALDSAKPSQVNPQPAQNTSSGGTSKPIPNPKPSGSPAGIPTPKPAEAPMTPACTSLKNARARNQNPQIINALVEKCRASGGDPDKAR
jgi:eukaryotic-like serine/threonine-protein kinase